MFRFFSEQVDELVAQGDHTGLDLLIADAKAAKSEGSGPPQCEIVRAEQKFIQLASALRRERRAA